MISCTVLCTVLCQPVPPVTDSALQSGQHKTQNKGERCHLMADLGLTSSRRKLTQPLLYSTPESQQEIIDKSPLELSGHV